MEDPVIRGSVAVVGDYVSGDVILPARYAFLDAEGMAAHVLDELDASANARVRRASILVAGKAFGYGTGRESSARALRAAGVRLVIGGPFARMFYRNAVNNGLLVLDCPEVVAAVPEDGALMEVDLDTGAVEVNGRSYSAPPVVSIVRAIADAGDLVAYGRLVLRGAAGEPGNV